MIVLSILGVPLFVHNAKFLFFFFKLNNFHLTNKYLEETVCRIFKTIHIPTFLITFHTKYGKLVPDSFYPS